MANQGRTRVGAEELERCSQHLRELQGLLEGHRMVPAGGALGEAFMDRLVESGRLGEASEVSQERDRTIKRLMESYGECVRSVPGADPQDLFMLRNLGLIRDPLASEAKDLSRHLLISAREAAIATRGDLKDLGLIEKDQALAPIAAVLAAAGDSAAARDTVEMVWRANTKAMTYVSVAKALAAAGDAPSAREAANAAIDVAATIEASEQQVAALAQAARVLAEVGAPSAAREAVQSARSSAEGIYEGESLLSREGAWREISVALAATGDLSAARAITDGLHPRSGDLDLALIGIAEASCAAGDPASGLAAARAIVNSWPGMEDHVPPARRTALYRVANSSVALATALNSADEPAAARWVASHGLQASADLGYPVGTVTAVARVLAEAGDASGAQDAISRAVMDASGDPEDLALEFAAVAKAQAAAGEMAKARAAAERARSAASMLGTTRTPAYRQAMALSAVAEAFAAAGDRHRALETAATAAARAATSAPEAPDKRAQALIRSARAMEAAGDATGAKETAELAMATVASIEHPAGRAHVLSMLVKWMAEDSPRKPSDEAMRRAVAASVAEPPPTPVAPSRNAPHTPAAPRGNAPAVTPSQSRPSTRSSTQSGCFIATAVYGSYDCPEVRVLRRYRDERLASTAAGRTVIRSYYNVSPRVVSSFGDRLWFPRLFRGPLDRFVTRLQATGYSSSPYLDREQGAVQGESARVIS